MKKIFQKPDAPSFTTASVLEESSTVTPADPITEIIQATADAAPKAKKPARPRPCKFFNTEAGCKLAEKCGFRHVPYRKKVCFYFSLFLATWSNFTLKR